MAGTVVRQGAGNSDKNVTWLGPKFDSQTGRIFFKLKNGPKMGLGHWGLAWPVQNGRLYSLDVSEYSYGQGEYNWGLGD